jgi:hypothetical protein
MEELGIDSATSLLVVTEDSADYSVNSLLGSLPFPLDPNIRLKIDF